MKNKFRAFDLLILLSAFLYGNLFVMSFSKLDWGFFLISCIVLFVEGGNKILYSRFLKKNGKQPHKTFANSKKISFWDQQRGFAFAPLIQRRKTNEKDFFKGPYLISILLNTLKRGFLLGFFIEAFKVGS